MGYLDSRTSHRTVFGEHETGGELEQIQVSFGHVSLQTTEWYLGRRQRLPNAVNDHIGLKPEAANC